MCPIGYTNIKSDSNHFELRYKTKLVSHRMGYIEKKTRSFSNKICFILFLIVLICSSNLI